MNVIVTGGAGLVGRSLQELCPQYIYLTRQDGDLRSMQDVQSIFEKHQPDIVIHLASHVGGVYDNIEHNYLYFHDNTKMHINIVDACRKYKVKKLVNILSTCIFPDKNVTYPLSQDQLHNGLPHSSNIGYAYSKRILQVASQILSMTHNIRIINLIPTNLYGEHDQYNLKRAHVIPALIHKTFLALRDHSPLKIMGAGNARRQFLYVKDLAKIIQHFVTYQVDYDVSCIVSPPTDEEVSIRELVSKILDSFGNDRAHVSFDATCSEGQHLKTTDDTELRIHMPHMTFTPLNQGLQNVINHFQSHYSELRI